MKEYSGMFEFYKKVGETPLEAINRFRKENKKENPELEFLPVTYVGRLDPMAEGLLVLLVGEETKNKEKYLGLTKTYVFEVLWEVETDTSDLLGLITDNSFSKTLPSQTEVEKYLEASTKKFEQMYPAYSSRPVGGKPLFEWAREGKISEVDIPKHEVEVFSAKFLGRKEIEKNNLQKQILDKIGLVNGDFRQEEIKSAWQGFFTKSSDVFYIDKFELSVSSGFYVRQFVSDMGRSLGSSATTFSIKRTKVGDMGVANIP